MKPYVGIFLPQNTVLIIFLVSSKELAAAFAYRVLYTACLVVVDTATSSGTGSSHLCYTVHLLSELFHEKNNEMVMYHFVLCFIHSVIYIKFFSDWKHLHNNQVCCFQRKRLQVGFVGREERVLENSTAIMFVAFTRDNKLYCGLESLFLIILKWRIQKCLKKTELLHVSMIENCQ